MGSYMRLVRFLKDFKPDVAGKVLIGLLLSAAGFFQAYMIAMGVSAVFESRAPRTVALCLLGVAAAILFRGLLTRYQEGYARKMAARVKDSIRGALLDKLLQLGPAYQNDRRSGNMQSLITDGVESLEAFLVGYIPQTAVVVISVTVVILFIGALDLTVGLIILAAALLSVLAPHLFMPAISRLMVEYWQDYAHLNAQYIEAMQGMSTLKAFHASEEKNRSLARDARVFAETSIRNTGMSLADSALIILLSAVGTSISVAVAAMHTASGTLSPQGLLIILFLAGECMRPLYELNTHWHGSYLGFSVAEQLYAVLDAPVPLTEVLPEQGRTLAGAPPAVALENVTFRYAEDAVPALDGVTLRAEPGRTVAIVGKSGSGKSTIVNLLLRFYDAQEGAVLLDGADMREYSLGYLRGQIAVVFQDTYLFYGTVAENLRMAKPGATPEELTAAARTANAHEFIVNLPQGYDTIVGERGATLSGGERQRIAIARALLKDAPVLVLDEATSSVDVAGERLIQDALAKLMRGRTTIVIAHRLSTIAQAERIFVLESGRLREQGAHSSLMEQGGEYAGLVRAQRSVREIG